MLLTIDAGNTNTEFALFDGDVMVNQWRATSMQRKTSDEWASWLFGLMSVAQISVPAIHRSIISCVRPDLLMDLELFCQDYLCHNPMVIGKCALDFPMGFTVGNPQEVGADLIATCVAAKQLYGAPALVLDMGTATTLSLLDEQQNFAGVAIAPGLKLSTEALFQGAAKLPSVPWGKTDRVIGTTTLSAIQGGVFWGYLGLIENLMMKAQEQFLRDCPGTHLKIIATGGLARYFVNETDAIDIYDPDLCIKGLRMIADYNK